MISTLATTFTTVGAFQLPSASHDAVLLLMLAPAVCSVQVNAADSKSSGVSLVEIYEVR